MTAEPSRQPRLGGAVGAVGVTLLALVLRLWKLGAPHKLIFDETYYVKDAYSLLTRGVELKWAEEANAAFEAGDFSGLLADPAYVVHPPVGKWLIAFGMWLFGPESSFGWRFSAAIAGTLGVLLTILIGWRLFRSQALGLLAGLLVAVDGISLVLSRSGLLDIFLMLFALLALWLVLKDRAVMDRRLAERMRQPIGHGPTGAPIYPGRRVQPVRPGGPDGIGKPGEDGIGKPGKPGKPSKPSGPREPGGPGLGMRWYLLGAGVALGLACGVKWSGLYFLAVYGLLVVCWDAAARRRAGLRGWLWTAVWRDGLKAFALMVPVALVVYVASWTGWLATKAGYHRDWAQTHPGEGVQWLPDGLRSLVKYHQEAWGFHTTLTSEHDYESNPALWLLQARPTSFFYESEPTCAAASCSQAITALGNPLIWWVGVIALGVVVYQAIVWADRRAWAILCGYVAGYVPWLFFAERTIFTFYTVAFVPFVTLALAYAAGVVIGPVGVGRAGLRSAGVRSAGGSVLGGVSGFAGVSGSAERAARGPAPVVIVGVVVALMLFVSAFFWPIWTAESVPYQFWQMHMWFSSWV
ncbi:MAG: glycosyltransferase family 39 protein [Bifidobacteriaceae bacterium]|nr:glycosyltransferase family 39 protein [Bifidobacteriaceae bacterium]